MTEGAGFVDVSVEPNGDDGEFVRERDHERVVHERDAERGLSVVVSAVIEAEKPGRDPSEDATDRP